MNTTKKLFAGMALIAAISSTLSVATYAYLTGDNGFLNNTSGRTATEEGFAQPVRFTNTAASAAIETDFTVAAEQTVHGVVHIKSSATRQAQSRGRSSDPFFDFFFGERGYGPQQPQRQEGFGSGVIISSDGYIVTNNHVISGADEIDVTLNNNRSYKAKVVGSDPTTDIALIKIEAKDLPTIPFGDSDKLKVGEWVLAVGNPFNLSSTVTAGIVSQKARSIGIIANANNRMGIESFIQTDAAINPGNSGGALVNTRGELVGINTAIASRTGSYAGYAFAVPVSIVSKVVTDLKQYGAVQRALLGVNIREMDSELAKEKNIKITEGIYVAGVNDRSAAMAAGIKEGDVIVQINDVKVKGTAELQEQVSRYRPGDKIKVKALRDGEYKDFSVVLKNAQGTTEIVKESGTTELGAAMRELPSEARQRLGISYGVEVTGLQNGKFQEAGIRRGYIILKINDQRISTPEDVIKVMGDINNGAYEERVMFITGIYPNGRTAYYAVDLGEATNK